MKTIILIIAMFLLPACGKKAEYTKSDTQTCTITEDTMVCPDGIEYILPEPDESEVPVIIAPEHEITVIVVTIPAEETEPEAVCEKNNKNKRKCRKVKKVGKK